MTFLSVFSRRRDELAQRRVVGPRPLGEALHETGERLRRPEQAGIEEVEDRPQIAKIILNRRAGERDAALRVEGLDRAGLLGLGVLDRLRLVDNGETPAGLAEPIEPEQRGVAGHDEIDTSEVLGRSRFQPLGRRERGMGDEHVERRGEALGLGRPVGDERRRRDNEARPALAAALANRQQQRENLDRLAEPHVVGETGPEAKS
jgi:hypothetical protein